MTKADSVEKAYLVHVVVDWLGERHLDLQHLCNRLFQCYNYKRNNMYA